MKILPLKLEIYQYRSSRYEELKQFILDIQKQIGMMHDARQEVFKEEIKELEKLDDEEEKQYFMDLVHKDYFMFEQLYLDTPVKSALVMACSFLEHQMRDLKFLLDKHLIIKQKDGECEKGTKHFGIRALKVSIYRMTGLDFKSLNTLWEFIYKYIKIRNIIVHNGFELNKPEHFKIISSIPELEIDGRNFYLKQSKDIFKIIDSFNQYFKGLLEIISSGLDKNNIT